MCTVCVTNSVYFDENTCKCDDPNASYDITTNTCVCIAGYVKGPSACQQCPSNSIYQSPTCACTEPQAQYYLDTNNCVCNSGYSEFNKKCQLCPASTDYVPASLTCKCKDLNASYSPATNLCVCNSGTWASLNNECLSCINYLQVSSITASFINSYSQLQFTFGVNADSSVTGCLNLFEGTSLSQFGAGYTCTFSATFNNLVVNLGKGYTLAGGAVQFKAGALKSSISVCNLSAVILNVQIALPLPAPIPSVTLVAPTTLVLACQVLILDARLNPTALPFETYR